MKNNFLIIGFALAIFLALSSVEAVSSEVKPFEKVLSDYGIEEWRVIGDYELDESQEVPAYRFTYVYKQDYDPKNFMDRLIVRIRWVIRTKLKETIVPAVEMSKKDWGLNESGSLFLLSIDSRVSGFVSQLVMDRFSWFDV